MPDTAPTPRTRVRRLHDKAAYDREVINAILDAMPVAHVGHIVDGFPVVTPTLQWREGDRIYWHGSSASRMQKRAAGEQVCVTVTLTDGMLLARSGLEHSVNYRCVMVFGTAELVEGAAAKEAHLKEMMEQTFSRPLGPASPDHCAGTESHPHPFAPPVRGFGQESLPARRLTRPKTWPGRSGPGSCRSA
jgi:nitroimidazol reductase NimA-like FMN-containing flavoprotein (pyridoxamine 5'-phosphate oxidase superfamily)